MSDIESLKRQLLEAESKYAVAVEQGSIAAMNAALMAIEELRGLLEIECQLAGKAL